MNDEVTELCPPLTDSEQALAEYLALEAQRIRSELFLQEREGQEAQCWC